MSRTAISLGEWTALIWLAAEVDDGTLDRAIAKLAHRAARGDTPPERTRELRAALETLRGVQAAR